jgi:hypothetical protein
MAGERGLSLWQRLTTVVWFLLAVGFLLALPVLLGFSVWILAGVLLLAVVLALPVAAIARAVTDRRNGKPFTRRWLGVSVALAFVLSILAAAPMYYLAGVVATRPLVAPQATLSNGKKTIIFQGMAHVGSETFYKTVIYDLEHAIADGYAIYYEGVLPDPAGDAWFSKTLAGGGDLTARYKTLGKVCGLAFQGDYFQLLVEDIREHPERHVAADVSTLQMKQEYERLLAVDKAFAEKARKAADSEQDEADGADVIAKFLGWAQDGNPRHQSLAGVVCRGYMDIALTPKADKPPGDLDPLLLGYRNRVLVDRILADPRPRIYVNYGADHLPGVLKLLRQNDPSWKVVSVKWMRVIEAPEDLHGRL